MDCFSLSTATSARNFSPLQFFSHSSRILSFNARKPRKLIFFASKDDSKLDKWEQMEFKFGRMIGEDPKFTYAKIMAKKANPELNYLEIEKLLEKKGGKARKYEIEEIPFDLPEKRSSTNSANGLNLVRPVPRKGVDFEAYRNAVETDDKKSSQNSANGLNLVRPVPRKGVDFEVNRNAVETDDKKSSQSVRKPVQKSKSIVPNVILRKPNSFYEKDAESEKSSIFGMKPNLSLKMRKNPQKESFSDITLLKKPEPVTSKVEDETEDKSLKNNFSSAGKADDITLSEKPKLMNLNVNKEQERELPSDHVEFSSDITLSEKPKPMNLNVNDEQERELSSDHTEFGSGVTLSEKPKQMNLNENNGLEQELSSDHTEIRSVTDVTKNSSNVPNASSDLVKMMDGNFNQSSETRKGDSGDDDASSTELQAVEQISVETFNSSGASRTKSAESAPAISMDTLLTGKPKILDRSIKATEQQSSKDTIPVNFENSGNQSELENFPTKSPIEDHGDKDWERAEKLLNTEERAEVELISSSTKGFVVSFGSLIGFLPYRNLLARWKFINFESWLRNKGIDPSMYRQNLGIIGKYEATSSKVSAESMLDSKADYKADRQISPDMKFEDLLMIYDQEKQKFLSSFVGQKTKVVVTMANRKNRRLIVSIKPKETEDFVEKRRHLMEKLSVGDIVKCQITKMTYLGIFVEVEGIPALIHQAEVSWDTTLDLEAHFKVGQILEAKVLQLDFTVERIHLSLKSVTPDPLMEALEVVVGDHSSSGVQLEAAEADIEWADVEMLIKELQQVDGIESVSKGKYLLSPGLAPTFQVYMASMFENQYKLLARAGNRVQEVIVQSSLSKDELKSAILACTNRVE